MAQSIVKSEGVTETERMLADFCERSFLKLWTYPNPFKDDGHELCDVIACFGNHIFVFFDRESHLPAVPDKDPAVLWDRWKRTAIDRQVKTAHGAERYLRSGRAIFLDPKRSIPFPLSFDAQTAIVHKIVVAHGAKDACKQASDRNIYGSLAITYREIDEAEDSEPFHLFIDRSQPVHVFDSHNLPILLRELDTVSDLVGYLDEKARAIARFDFLSYCGEEDLLAHYLFNFDKVKQRHVIGPKSGEFSGVLIGEGEWRDFSASDVYRNTKNEDQISYYWDELIQRTCQNSLDGTLGGNTDLLRGQSAIVEMVREPRFMRRSLSEKIKNAVVGFPDHASQLTRQVTFVPSFWPNVGYVFFQLRVPDRLRGESDYLDKRRSLLEIACGAAKNKFPNLVKVIGIGMDAPKFAGETNSEDFILLPCAEWSDAQSTHYREQNEQWQFFGTPGLRQFKEHVTQFVQPTRGARVQTARVKVGRNDPCPCGSGKKSKKCHGA